MKTPPEILRDALTRKIRLTPSGADLLLEYDDEPDADFRQLLKANKPALLRYLTAKRHLAAQIVQGEFDGCTNGRTWHAILAAMLENNLDSLCFAAIRHLKASQRKNQHR
jgi:hypothetical protein